MQGSGGGVEEEELCRVVKVVLDEEELCRVVVVVLRRRSNAG